MAEGNWLLGRGMRRDVVRNFLLRRGALLSALLRPRCEGQEKEHHC
jgi:hypothetical protein